MKLAADFRKNARDALKGKWGIAVIAGLIASLLNGTNTATGSFDINFNLPEDMQSGGGEISLEGLSFESIISEIPAGILAFFGAFFGMFLIITIVFGVAFFILGSIISVGYSSFNLDISDGKNGDISTLFSYFRQWKVCVLSNLLRVVYISLWSLLLFIPGIIASYSYAMVPYIVAENPDISPREALRRSKALMVGNRWRLFCLQISFFGWVLLSILTLGIGFFWLIPYVETAQADFYREISSTRPIRSFGDPEFDYAFE